MLFHALAWIQATCPVQERDLDLLELFAGVGELSSAFAESGCRSATYDLSRDANEDMLTTGGWLKALRQVLRLKIGAVLWCGTPCSTWIFLSRGSTGRSTLNPLGRPLVQCVSDANILASRVCLLCIVAFARGASWAMEQPASSLLPLHPRVQLLRRLGAPSKDQTFLTAFMRRTL